MSVDNFGLWEVSCEIETIAYKISSVRNVVELIAEREVMEPESGAIWAVAEMLEVYENRLEKLSEEAMNLHRETKEDSKAKGKKK